MADQSVVDQLVVELGLDPSKLNDEQRAALDGLLRFQAGLKRAGKQIESDFKRVGDDLNDVFNKLATAFGLLVGASSITAFAVNTVELSRSIGIMADISGDSVQNINALGNAFHRLGGSSESILSVLRGVDREIKAIESNQTSLKSSTFLSAIRQLNSIGANIDARTADGKWKRPTELVLEIADAIPELQASRDRIIGILRTIPGMNDESINIIMRNSTKLREIIAEQKEIFAISDKDRATMDGLRKQFIELQQHAANSSLMILRQFASPLSTILELMTKFMQGLNASQEAWYMVPKTAIGIADMVGRMMRGEDVLGSGRGSPAGRGAGSDSAPAQQHGDSSAVPSDILDQAKAVALRGGPGAVEDFMRRMGYPRSGAWCGQFAAATVKAAGGTPPKNPAIASNWRSFGAVVEGAPQPGDIAVRKGVPTGSTGSHVTIVNQVDPQTGKFIGLGGNQGGAAKNSNFPLSRYEFRRPGGAFEGGRSDAIPFYDINPGAVISGRPNVTKDIRNTTRTDISSLTVNSQASDPAGIAADIARELKQQTAAQ